LVLAEDAALGLSDGTGLGLSEVVEAVTAGVGETEAV
jgi:hypothetical protein